MIPFLTLYVENDLFFPFITGKNFAFRILVEIGFASWVLLALLEKDYRPKFSWVLSAFTTLIVVMFFANLFGEYPYKSFWSNFERMDGYVTLIHVFLFFVTLGGALTTKKLWSAFLHTSLLAAFMVGMYGLAQYSGMVDGKVRIDSRLGNAAYMAIYMLFHIFIALWFFVESKNTLSRSIYGILTVMFVFLLLETGTRGTAVGLAVGLTVMATYIGLFGANFKKFRRYAIGLLLVLIIGAGSLYVARDSEFVQDNKNLRRIANISVDDLTVRFTIWGMAYEGVKERPILGWGQGNFNYVFNENYKPSLYGQEQWFDRVHNIFFDWLIAGGILGFLAYFSIFFACIYYLLVRPILRKDDSNFDVLERGVLLGLLAGYLTHNLVVFDNIVSYMFFGSILAFIHSRVATDIPALMNINIDKRLVNQLLFPVTVVCVGAVIYYVHVPGIMAAGDIIDAFRAGDPDSRLEQFEEAFSRNSFADQEITEQLAQQAIAISRNPNITRETKEFYVRKTENRALSMIEEKPGDARLHMFLGSFYRSVNQIEKAKEQFDIAQKLSPNKQNIILQQGSIEFSLQNFEAGRDYFKKAFELDERNIEAREVYAASLFYTGDPEAGKALIGDEYKSRFSENQFGLGGVNASGDLEYLAELYVVRTENKPEVAQNWASLAFLYYELGKTEEAIKALEKGSELIPGFTAQAECVIGNIETGVTPPQAGCIEG